MICTLFFFTFWITCAFAQSNTTATAPLLATIPPTLPCLTLCFPNRTITSTSFSTLPLVTTVVTLPPLTTTVIHTTTPPPSTTTQTSFTTLTATQTICPTAQGGLSVFVLPTTDSSGNVSLSVSASTIPPVTIPGSTVITTLIQTGSLSGSLTTFTTPCSTSTTTATATTTLLSINSTVVTPPSLTIL